MLRKKAPKWPSGHVVLHVIETTFADWLNASQCNWFLPGCLGLWSNDFMQAAEATAALRAKHGAQAARALLDDLRHQKVEAEPD
ncbi:unnamed protein product [Effrenium voratum]|nr:unnamed protein product [Effrenium voratum]